MICKPDVLIPADVSFDVRSAVGDFAAQPADDLSDTRSSSATFAPWSELTLKLEAAAIDHSDVVRAKI
jgi:hypothetical protein